MSPKILSAIEVAIKFHAGQLEANGDPYILHPLRVARTVARLGGDEDEVIAAVFHDLQEDTDVDPAYIRRAFGEKVAHLVNALTHNKSEPYEDYVRRAIASGAGRIKAADLLDNTDGERMAFIERTDPQKASRLKLKYARALLILGSSVPAAINQA